MTTNKIGTVLKIALVAALITPLCGRAFAAEPQNDVDMNRAALKTIREFLEAQNVTVIDEFKRAETLEDALKASCRVSVNGARGTGTFVGVDYVKKCAVILTNYHVVTTNNIATLDFWTNSIQQSVQGKIYARFYNPNLPADFALIAVDPLELAKINPPFVALAGADGAPSENSYIISAGCPKGRFVQAWKGKTLSYYHGRTIEFKPGPVPGQSGSGVLSYIDGELWLTAVLTWLIGTEGSDSSTGGAIPISILYECLDGQSPASEYYDSPIPPGAQECAEKAVAPCILEFAQENCPPCKDAENDVAQLRAFGATVYVYDVATEYGQKLAERYGVDRTPSFVLLDKDFGNPSIFTGAGKIDEILTAYRTLETQQQKQEKNLDGDAVSQPESSFATVPATSPASSSSPKTSQEAPSQIINLPELAPITVVNEDFRNRPIVYEMTGNVGLFEDSDARWKERRGLRDRIRPNEPKEDEEISPDDETPNPTPEKKSRPRIGEKLTDNAIEAIVSRVQKQIDERLQTMKDDLREKWEAVKFTALMGLCLALAIALLIAEGIVALIKFSWRKIAAKCKTVKEALNALKTQEENSK